ncbi:MAG TPA: YbjQ family protein, partial [Nocardioides sp.]|nr:YbjQ family protein [Nocardioides sp.]
LPGWTVHETLGLVFGNTVRTRGMGAKLVTGIAANFGGELPMYTQLLTDARIEALNRLAAEARHRGANGVVGLAFNTSSVFETAIEVVAYGTAVRASRPQ